ncbi:MAG: hypothetical protein K9G38_06620, partial [Bacteroidales bacterium]|nr:hypothetical protein [Bacteroidales bacterium]
MEEKIDKGDMQEMIPEFVENPFSDYSLELKGLIRALDRTVVKVPLIMVGLNTSGRIAGGDKVMDHVR